MKLITKIYLATGLILLVFSFVTFTYIRQSSAVAAHIKQVLQSNEAIKQIKATQKTLLDMETGLRGFLIAEKETFLEPYHSGKEQLPRDLQLLKKYFEYIPGKSFTP